jgi:flavin reductase (DIM6/NTAB) family NADH-FMN oxidoreductase RutF
VDVADWDSRTFRNTMGQFSTGVVIATGTLRGEPAGFAAQSFVSLSLDPPLIALCPGKSSTSWPKLRDAGRFCINVLAADQKAVCDIMAKSGIDKFASIAWRTGKTGSPILDGVIAWIDCELEAEHDAGDHTIAVGRVVDLGVDAAEKAPLLFFQGRYGSFSGV